MSLVKGKDVRGLSAVELDQKQETLEKELRIVRTKVPGLAERLAREVAIYMQSLRRAGLSKTPGVAEALDWAAALSLLGAEQLDEDIVRETLGCIVKDEGDLRAMEQKLDEGRLAAMLSLS